MRTANRAGRSPGPASGVGLFAVFLDQDGRRHAVRRQSVAAMVEDETGRTAVLLSGGRVVILAEGLEAALRLLG